MKNRSGGSTISIHVCTALTAAGYLLIFYMFGVKAGRDFTQIVIGEILFDALLVCSDLLISGVISGRHSSSRHVSACAWSVASTFAVLLVNAIFILFVPVSLPVFALIHLGAAAVLTIIFLPVVLRSKK